MNAPTESAGNGLNDGPSRAPLHQAAIVAAAVQLADEEGVVGLSMRALARRLGYEVMSLYNHVANKNELLSLMVDAIAAEIDTPADTEPMAAIRSIAVSTHDTFVRHPWAPELWQRHFPGPERIRGMEDLLRLLDASGLSPELGHYGFHAVTNHVLGYTLQQLGMTLPTGDMHSTIEEFLSGLSAEAHPHAINHVQQHLDGQEGNSFELVLDLILDGLTRLNAVD